MNLAVGIFCYLILRKIAFIACVLCISAGCRSPFEMGLAINIDAGGTSSMTQSVIEEKPHHLNLTGKYNLQAGSLTIELIAPDGKCPFARTYHAVNSGQIYQALQPEIGEWTMYVTSSSNSRGSYNIQLIF